MEGGMGGGCMCANFQRRWAREGVCGTGVCVCAGEGGGWEEDVCVQVF
jgi:hypothetical protein